jgi:diguanylate cyclase (GGDEF)-like protein
MPLERISMPGEPLYPATPFQASDGTEHNVSSPSAAREALARYEQLLRQQSEHLEHLHEDLHLARELQQAMLPLQYPTFPRDAAPHESALLFHHTYRANEAIGGDFFAIFQLSESTAGVFLCDVMGHGVRAALVTAMIRALLEELKPVAHEPGTLLGELNRGLSDILRRARTPVFTSAFYMVADAATGVMRHANGGHPIPMRGRRGEGTVCALACGAFGPVLGMIEDAAYPTTQTQIEAGDVLLLFTDGLFEIKRNDGEFFGCERVQEALQNQLRAAPHAPLSTLCDGVLTEATNFAGDFDDDLCLVAFEAARIGGFVEAGRDGLTGLFNQHYLQESIEREVSRAERNGYQVGVIALDLVGIERLIAQDGQSAADQLLREFGTMLNRCTRRSDIACRARPTGFTLILPEASIENTERKAEQICELLRVQGHDLFAKGELSLALGLASFPQHGATGHAIVQAATEAMQKHHT